MHRSGTGMITRILEEMGLFVGKKKDVNYEALFFQKINNWLLHQCGGTWDNPSPIYYLLENTEIRSLAENYIRYIMNTPRLVNYIGWGKYLRYRTPFNIVFPWGWKDPRNTFTLPIWLDIFPNAKVVHIYRHGVDVANSLKVRQERLLNSKKILYKKLKSFFWLRPKRGGFTDTVRCTTLEGSFSLWEEYLEEARSHLHNLKNQAMEFKYEDFLSEPYKMLESMVNFCDLTPDDEKIEKVAGYDEKARAYAYLGNPELKIFENWVTERLRAKGY